MAYEAKEYARLRNSPVFWLAVGSTLLLVPYYGMKYFQHDYDVKNHQKIEACVVPLRAEKSGKTEREIYAHCICRVIVDDRKPAMKNPDAVAPKMFEICEKSMIKHMPDGMLRQNSGKFTMESAKEPDRGKKPKMAAEEHSEGPAEEHPAEHH